MVIRLFSESISLVESFINYLGSSNLAILCILTLIQEFWGETSSLCIELVTHIF